MHLCCLKKIGAAVVVFTLKTILTSIQYLLFLTLQDKETNLRSQELTQNEVQKNIYGVFLDEVSCT